MPLRTVLRIARFGVAAFLLALLGTRTLHADANGQWQGIAPPAGRYDHAAVYDPGHDRFIVLLGQYDPNAPSLVERDVWIRSFAPFGGWHQMMPSGTSPFGSVAGQMVYDSLRERFVLASGSTLTTLDLTTQAWTTTTIAGTPPSSRSGTTALYDAQADRIVYFGGASGNTAFDEVWSVELSATPTWVPITPSGTPPAARAHACAAYDVAGGRMIVFGGYDGQIPRNDVWSLSLGGSPAWTEITPAVPGPGGRTDAAVMVDPVRNRMLLHGGDSGDATLWALELGPTPAWSVVTTTGVGPGERWNHTASYDALRDRMLLYGGGQEGSYPSGKLLALDLASGAWTDLSDTRPSPRHGHTAVYDAAGQRMILFGGGSYDGEGAGETWSLSLGVQPTWTNLAPSGSPSAFEGHTAIVDPVRHRMLAFSAWPSGDVWSFDLAGAPAWTLLPTAGTPPGYRSGHVAIYDPNGDRMIVFGGTNFSGVLTDVWQLTLSGTPTWSPLSPTGTGPGQLNRPAAIYDPLGARMLIFGGVSTGAAGKLWSLSLTGSPAWQLLTPSGTAPKDFGAYAAVYDDSRQRMLLFGGGVSSSFNSTSTYALPLAGPLQWNLLAPTGARPVTRCGASAIYDPAGDRMVIYGGEYCNGLGYIVDEDTAWSLAFSSTVSTPLPALTSGLQLFPAVPNPASGDVTLSFALPRPASASLAIYDLAGRKIAVVFSGALTAGRHEVRWTRAAREAAGLDAGVYFSELRVGSQRVARRMVVTR